MNMEKLIDSIGSIDEKYISETDNIRLSAKRKKMCLRKMIMLPIAASLTISTLSSTKLQKSKQTLIRRSFS